MMFRSIRHSLFAALAGFTVLICLCYTALALVIAYVTEDMLVDRLLQREAGALSAQYRLHGKLKPPASDWITVYHQAATLPAPVRAQVAAGRQRGEIFTGTGQHYHLRTLDLGLAGAAPQRVYLLADAAPLLVVSTLIREVGGLVLALALGLIALALLLAWLLARRLVQPLQRLADEVRTLAPDHAIVFSAQGRNDEIGYLADKLGATLAELQAALSREQAFTRDVSHELRTPLTVLRNALGPAPHDVAQLRASVDAISATVELLFALARAGHIGSEVFDLRACIEESLLQLIGTQARADDWLVIDLPDHLDVSGHRHLTMLLLNNCFSNALFHGGADCRLRVDLQQGTLGLANTTDDGKPGAIQGFQHGHNLLVRIAAAMDWQLTFHQHAGMYRVEIVPRMA